MTLAENIPTERLLVLRAALTKFDPSEPRDDAGKWTADGGADLTGLRPGEVAARVEALTGTKVSFAREDNYGNPLPDVKVKAAEFARAMGEYLHLHQLFPNVKIDSIDFRSGKGIVTDKNLGVQAWTTTSPWKDESQIHLATEFWRSGGRGDLAGRLNMGFTAVPGPEGVIAHEFGHAVDNMAMRALGRETVYPNTPEAWRNGAFHDAPTISGYGATAIGEKFAELFSAVYATPTGTPDYISGRVPVPPDQAEAIKAYLGAAFPTAKIAKGGSSPLQFSAAALQALQDAYSQAYNDGFDDADPEGGTEPTDEGIQEAIDNASSSDLSNLLTSLAALTMGGTVSAAMLLARIRTYEASLYALYNLGFDDAIGRGGEVTQVEWVSVDDKFTCPDCADLDAQTWLKEEGHPYPGASPFGGPIRCGPNCRCELHYSLLEELPGEEDYLGDYMSQDEEQASHEYEAAALPDLTKMSLDELVALRAFAAKYSEAQPREPAGSPEGGRWTSGGDVVGAPVVWPTTGGRDLWPKPLPESIQPVIGHVNETTGGTTVSGPDEKQITEWKQKAAAAVADHLNTPERIAALSRSPALANFLYRGEGFYAHNALLATAQAGWANATPDQRAQWLADPTVRAAMAAGYIASWAGSSSDADPEALALQMAAAHEFGVPSDVRNYYTGASPDDWHAAAASKALSDAQGYLAHNEDGYRALLGANYDATQQALAAAGVSEVTVTRGMSTAPPEVPRTESPVLNIPVPDWGPDRTWTGVVTSNPLSSWTTDRSVARGFGDYHLSTTVPASQVFSTPATGLGCSPESEIVLIGGPIRVLADEKWS